MRPEVLCDEDYPPIDGSFQERTYGRPLSAETARGYWAAAAALVRSGRAPPGAGLAVLWPFCAHRCAYCYCDCRTPSAGEQDTALDLVLREASWFSGAMNGLPFAELNLMGGTPAHAGAPRLLKLLAGLREAFSFAAGAAFSVEATPASLTPEVFAALKDAGMTRLDMGIDTLDPAVLSKAGRTGQDAGAVREALDLWARSRGVSLDLNLVCGLEHQTGASFLRDVKSAAGRRPDRIRLYAFDPRPQTLFASSGGIFSEARKRDISAVLAAAGTLLESAGYRSARLGWTSPPSILGLGFAAKSRAFGGGWYQHPPLGAGPVPRSGLLPFLGMEMDLEEEEIGFAVRGLAERGLVSRDEMERLFGRDPAAAGPLAGPLRDLLASGGLSEKGRELRLGPDRSVLSSLYSPRVRAALGRSSGGRGAADTRCRVFERELS